MGVVYGQSLNGSVFIITDHQIVFDNDVIVLSSDIPLNLSSLNSTAQVNSTQTIGTLTVDLTQEVTFVSFNNNVITLENSELSTVSIEIPDQTTISAPQNWDKTILPPVEITTTGIIPSGFQTPDSVIQVGSTNVVLIFDNPVTIILEGVTGQTAYKLPGENTWHLIDGCGGLYTTPTDPDFPKECSISFGGNTKIVTYHFTEFGGFEETPVETTSPPAESSTTNNSPGGDRVGSSGSSSIPGQILVPEEKDVKLPEWFRLVVLWWAEGEITEEEMNNALNWLIANI